VRGWRRAPKRLQQSVPASVARSRIVHRGRLQFGLQTLAARRLR
jgi:hypothetical protein